MQLTSVWDNQVQFQPQVALYHESGDYILHNFRVNSWIVVDKIRYNGIVAPLQHKGLTPAQTAQQFAGRYGISEAEARQKVGKVLMLLWANCIADHPNKPWQPPNSIELKRGVPKIIYFVTTYRCNLACKYCYAESSPQIDTKRDLSTQEAMDMIDQIADLGIPVISFTGGEALLRRDCIDLMAHAKERGLIVLLITNGSPVTAEKVERMAPILTAVTVSMDSPSAETGHDAVRGKRSWQSASRAIELFKNAGVPVAVNTTVTAASVDTLPDMIQWVLDQKLRTHRIGAVSDLGRGEEARLAASTQKLIEAERASHRLLIDRLEEVPLDSLKFLHSPAPRFTTKKHCGVGVDEISIDSLGTVYPCKLLHEPQFAAGNIREAKLRDILGHSEVLDSMLAAAPANLPACKNCTFLHNCGGGCRAHQYSMTGDVMGTFTKECPMLRRSLRRHMWLQWKQFEAKNERSSGKAIPAALVTTRKSEEAETCS